MSLLLTILLWILATVGIILAVVLLAPVSIRAAGRVQGLSASGWARASWAFGFLSFRADSKSGVALYWLGLRIWRFKMKWHKESRPEKKKKEKKEKKPDKGFGWFIGNRRMFTWMAGRMFRTLHLRGRISGRVGLGDPADMAWLWMFLWQMEARVPGLELPVECDWQDEVLDLEGNIRAWVVPVHMGIVALFTFLRRDVRRALRSVS